MCLGIICAHDPSPARVVVDRILRRVKLGCAAFAGSGLIVLSGLDLLGLSLLNEVD